MLKSSEHNHQAGLVSWFRQKYPGVLIFAVPNGEYRAMSTAKKLKAEGVVPGIPDLCVPAWGPLWIEMKVESGGVVSKEQKRIHAYLVKNGQPVIIGNGATDASRQILEYKHKMDSEACSDPEFNK